MTAAHRFLTGKYKKVEKKRDFLPRKRREAKFFRQQTLAKANKFFYFCRDKALFLIYGEKRPPNLSYTLLTIYNINLIQNQLYVVN